MADPSVTTDAAAVAETPAQVDPGAQRPQQIERVSVGVQGESKPPWSVYIDPEERKQAERRERERNALRENATGDHYEFLGHEDPGNGTRTLETVNGVVHVGGTIQFTDDLLQKHKNLGFRFRKVADEKAAEKADAPDDKSGKKTTK